MLQLIRRVGRAVRAGWSSVARKGTGWTSWDARQWDDGMHRRDRWS